MVEIRSYPARNGDAFLIKATLERIAILVDGGYAETFHEHIRGDLIALAGAGYSLNLVIATHVDADHISGLLALFRQNGRSSAPNIIAIQNVFHNSLCSLLPTTILPKKVSEEDSALIAEIRTLGYPVQSTVDRSTSEISARQGNSLASLLRQHNYKWNNSSGEIEIGGTGIRELTLPHTCVKVIGPNKKRLEALKKWWIGEVRRLGLAGTLEGLDDVFEFLTAREQSTQTEQTISSTDLDLIESYIPDNSITNGSSISVIIEIENKTLLFLGDSWAEDTISVIESEGPHFFDVIKVSHHGSARNTSVDLLNLIDGEHFLISTNGNGHGHPDFAVLKAIVDRPTDRTRKLHFNYSTPASQKLFSYAPTFHGKFVVAEGQTGWITIE